MKFFKPTTLLDRFYELGITIKFLDGLFELIGGCLILGLSSGTILSIAHALTHDELAQDPHDFIATHILHAGTSLAHGHAGFASAFLIIHGGVKVGLVICLWLNKLWAYPLGLIVLGLLLIYQLYRLAVGPTFGMVFLSVLDAIIIWLIWREWQHVRAKPAAAS